jgi:hypothetical protein
LTRFEATWYRAAVKTRSLVVAAAAAAAAAVAAVAGWRWSTERRPPEWDPGCETDGAQVVKRESFGPDDLADKINGHADFYVSTGFVHLDCAVIGSGADRSPWFEVCSYDMGSFRRAFSVFTRQVRQGADAFDDDLGYDVPDGASFFVDGSHYFEVIPGSDDHQSRGLARSWVKCYRREHRLRQEEVPESRLLPASDRVPNSVVLLYQAAFGFDRLDGVVAARYRTGAGDATAFVSVRGSAAEATELADAFVSFLVEAGGTEDGPAERGVRFVRLHDMWDAVFSRDRIVAGVHAAPTREAARSLAAGIGRAERP